MTDRQLAAYAYAQNQSLHYVDGMAFTRSDESNKFVGFVAGCDWIATEGGTLYLNMASLERLYDEFCKAFDID